MSVDAALADTDADALMAATRSGAIGQPAPGRGHLSALRGLLVLSQLMTETGSEPQILQLASTAIPALAPTSVAGVLMEDGRWVGLTAMPVARSVLLELGVDGGPLPSGEAGEWSWAFPVRSLSGHLGHLVVVAPTEPSEEEQFLLRALAQQTGAALGNARLHAAERATAAELEAVNVRLEETVAALRRGIEIHDRLTKVAVSGGGREGIAAALHEVTGFPIAVEDHYGNLRAWAGPNQPVPYPKDPSARREQLFRRALREGHPIRDGGRFVAVARPRPDLLGVIVLVDPAHAAGEQELMALEHGTTVLAMELARLRSLAESELRVRRDLVDELLAGTDEESALRRAQALGYDLEQPHRVVVVEGRDRVGDPEAFLHAVRRAARDQPVGTLLVTRGEQVIVLANHETDWDRFRLSVLRELGGGRCRVGVGGRCDEIPGLPRSHRQAQLVLDLQKEAGWEDRACRFEDLGVFQLLATTDDPEEVTRFIDRWLGALHRYDEAKGAELIQTLSQYLECGGNYDATAQALFIHRSTLKYRLQRIRDISGLDLNDPDTRFNLQLATRAKQTMRALQRGEPR